MDTGKNNTDGAAIRNTNDPIDVAKPPNLTVIDLPRRTYSRQNQDTSYQKVTQASECSTHSN